LQVVAEDRIRKQTNLGFIEGELVDEIEID
jgi:hypothetical protein